MSALFHTLIKDDLALMRNKSLFGGRRGVPPIMSGIVPLDVMAHTPFAIAHTLCLGNHWLDDWEFWDIFISSEKWVDFYWGLLHIGRRSRLQIRSFL